ncbi:hypothetical protein ACFVTC_18840 [Streptomyces sp. NPDC057950]
MSAFFIAAPSSSFTGGRRGRMGATLHLSTDDTVVQIAIAIAAP